MAAFAVLLPGMQLDANPYKIGLLRTRSANLGLATSNPRSAKGKGRNVEKDSWQKTCLVVFTSLDQPDLVCLAENSYFGSAHHALCDLPVYGQKGLTKC